LRMRIATFNVQNLRLRHPSGRARLDGARDGDVPGDNTAEASALDLADRRLTAAVLARADADVLCLQEVFDRETLDFFHDHLMRHAGARPYPHRVCLPGNDGGGRDLALLSRLPLSDVRSHASLTPQALELEPPVGIRPDAPLFRRDCLTARVGPLTLFLCHFKAPWPDAASAWPVRRMEALAVRRLVEDMFAGDEAPLWLIVGDLNEPAGKMATGEPAIAPLLQGFSVDLLDRVPEQERWTFYESDTGRYARPDALLASPELARRWPDARPVAQREGMAREVTRHTGQRLADVGQHRPRASDHAPLVVTFDGL